jgi:hypothetical protein
MHRQPHPTKNFLLQNGNSTNLKTSCSLWVPVAHAYNPSYLGAEIGRITVWGQLGQNVHETPISKITRAKWTGGVTQAVECLLCKHEALMANPNPTRKKRKKSCPQALQRLSAQCPLSRVASTKHGITVPEAQPFTKLLCVLLKCQSPLVVHIFILMSQCKVFFKPFLIATQTLRFQKLIPWPPFPAPSSLPLGIEVQLS